MQNDNTIFLMAMSCRGQAMREIKRGLLIMSNHRYDDTFGPKYLHFFPVGELVSGVGSSAEGKDHAVNWDQLSFTVGELVELELSLWTEDISPPELM